MKKKYLKPEMEITEFDMEDVIVTSTGHDGNDDESPGEIPGGNNGG